LSVITNRLDAAQQTRDGVLQYAAQEADRLLHRPIGPEHLLLGLLCHEQGLAWEILREHGLSLTSIREALVIHVSANSPPPPRPQDCSPG
jgi:ATP-dependent Clp protease ATP-binding subunit ClpA